MEEEMDVMGPEPQKEGNWWRVYARIGPKYDFIGIGTENAGQRTGWTFSYVPRNEDGSLPEGYNVAKPASTKPEPKEDGFVNPPMAESLVAEEPKRGEKAQNNPSDPRLNNIFVQKDDNGFYEIRRPYYSEDMDDGSAGLHDRENAKKEKTNNETKGVPSLINKFAIVRLKGAYTDETDKAYSLIDTPGKRRWYEDFDFGGPIDNRNLNLPGYSKDVTVSKLIDFGLANPRGVTPYNYSDFAYCTYFNRIPNNYLITLRRFAVPTFDSLDFPFFTDTSKIIKGSETGTVKDKDGKEVKKTMPTIKVENDKSEPTIDKQLKSPPIAQAITWLGDVTDNKLSSLLSFSCGLGWKPLKAKVNENSEQMDDPASSNLPGWMKGFASSLAMLEANVAGKGANIHSGTPPDPYEDGPYANRVIGPVNKIDSVMQRDDDGLKFDHKLSLNFHYSSRSIGNINSKAAMLDIISNFLLLCYSSAPFWGGVNRFRGSAQAYPWKKGMAAIYSGNPAKALNAITHSLSNIGSALTDMLNNILQNPIEGLKALAGNVGQKLFQHQLAGKAPMFKGMRALLTGEPVGDWHLVIGNPFNPIMMIGNLVCTGCDFKFNDELSADDFPTEMTVTVTLEHGMPRDRIAIESMFNKGSGRIYALPDGLEQSLSSNNETGVDKNTGTRNPYVNKVMGVDKLSNTTNGIKGKAQFDQIVDSTQKAKKVAVDQGTRLAAIMEMGYGSYGEGKK